MANLVLLNAPTKHEVYLLDLTETETKPLTSLTRPGIELRMKLMQIGLQMTIFSKYTEMQSTKFSRLTFRSHNKSVIFFVKTILCAYYLSRSIKAF